MGTEISREEIDDVVCNIMMQDGPDRHIDGHDVITDLIVSVLKDNFYQWKQNYYSKKCIEE